VNEPVEIEKRRPFRQVDIERAFFEQGGCCALCPAELTRYIADHRVPRAMGGKTTYANLQLICAGCAAEKDPADISDIARAKRIARKNDPLTRPRPKRPMKGQGFDKRFHQHMDGTRSRR
jgi:5-methylcytosine-specific restriction endonuclease McrA